MPLELAFLTKDLRATCESPARARRELGEGAAAALRRVLAEMEASDSVEELLGLGVDVSCEEAPGVIRIELVDGVSVYCSVGSVSQVENHRIDFSSVTRLKFVRIGGAL